MQGFDRKGVAVRIRALICGLEDCNIPMAARELGVEELALRMSVDDVSPYPTVDVLIAVIQRYGLDPNWLLTGTYDPAMHRRVAADDASSVSDALREIARRATPPMELPAAESERPRHVFPE
jgi:hypothetical protein